MIMKLLQPASVRHFVLSFCLIVVGTVSHSESSLPELLSQLEKVQQDDNATFEELEAASQAMEQIVIEFPSSDAAVSILLEEPYNGLDFSTLAMRLSSIEQDRGPECLRASLDSQLASDLEVSIDLNEAGSLTGLPDLLQPSQPSSEARLDYLRVVAALDECAPYGGVYAEGAYQVTFSSEGSVAFQSIATTETVTDNVDTVSIQPVDDIVQNNGYPPEFSLTSVETEQGLALTRQNVRDIQARLLVIDIDPNGVDGVVGSGTRAAISRWQESLGVSETGYLNALQLQRLRDDTQTELGLWLQDASNARVYEPPAPVSLTPSRMSGNWQYTTTCGRTSRLGELQITGSFSVNHTGGNNYSGRMTNSQGFRGDFRGTLSGRNVTGEVNFGLLVGRVSFSARVDDQRLIMRGRDSNGCSFYASR